MRRAGKKRGKIQLAAAAWCVVHQHSRHLAVVAFTGADCSLQQARWGAGEERQATVCIVPANLQGNEPQGMSKNQGIKESQGLPKHHT
jgi:hypothetical protein